MEIEELLILFQDCIQIVPGLNTNDQYATMLHKMADLCAGVDNPKDFTFLLNCIYVYLDLNMNINPDPHELKARKYIKQLFLESAIEEHKFQNLTPMKRE